MAGSEDSFYSEAKEEIVIPKKKQAKRKLRANEAASPKRIKPNPKPELRVLKKLVSRAIPSNQAPKEWPRASIEPPGPPPGAPPSKELRPKLSSIPSRGYKFERGPTVFYCDYVINVTYKIQYKYPNCNFSKVFYRKSNQNIPMAEILSELKKGDAGF